VTDPYEPPPREPEPWSEDRRRSASTGELLLKVLAGIAVFALLGVFALAALYFWVMSSYGDNK
jgi:hypothetical protein